VKVSRQRQNWTCFNPDRPCSHSSNPSRPTVTYCAEYAFMLAKE
jgi:hypothetical protein